MRSWQTQNGCDCHDGYRTEKRGGKRRQRESDLTGKAVTTTLVDGEEQIQPRRRSLARHDGVGDDDTDVSDIPEIMATEQGSARRRLARTRARLKPVGVGEARGGEVLAVVDVRVDGKEESEAMTLHTHDQRSGAIMATMQTTDARRSDASERERREGFVRERRTRRECGGGARRKMSRWLGFCRCRGFYRRRQSSSSVPSNHGDVAPF
jgi:hypothetical protein